MSSTNIGNLHDLKPGHYFSGIVKVLRVAKPGPVILSVYDGTGLMDAVIRDSVFQETRSFQPKRNIPSGNVIIKDSTKKNKNKDSEDTSSPIREKDIKVGKVFEIRGECQARGEQVQIEVESITSSTYDFNELLSLRSAPLQDSFSIDSDRYEKMKSKFIEVATRIRFALLQGQPVFIRHHNDSDGICAGLAVEKACLMFMKQCGLTPEHRLYRSPSISPFYDPIDLFRDINMFQRYSEQFGDPNPLILLLDTGSTPENIFCLKILQTFQYECIIVDHHNPGPLTDGKSAVCDLITNHLNPYLFGLDNQTSAGMLCYELARFIFEEYMQPLFPAVAALADRCSIPEVELLINNAEKSKEHLISIGIAIDYLAYHLKFDAGEGIYHKLFHDENLIQIINENVRNSVNTQLESTMPYVKSQEINGVFYSEIELERYTQRFKYPTPGKVLGMIHDNLAATKGKQPVMTVGYFSDGVIIRATQPIVPVPTLLEQLQKEMPEANVEGGGHETAGSLKYIPAHCQAILDYIKQEIRKHNPASLEITE
jgi:RecJ-like exonuclease